MGCGSISTNQAQTSSIEAKCHFTVFVQHPDRDEKANFFYAHHESFISFVDLMNLLAFDGAAVAEFDSNFVSVYGPGSGSFKYFVQRLLGLEMENEQSPETGKLWVPYVNGQKMSWNEICQKEVTLLPTDLVEWHFEASDKA